MATKREKAERKISNLTLDDETLAELDRIATENERSRVGQIRVFVKQGVAAYVAAHSRSSR